MGDWKLNFGVWVPVALTLMFLLGAFGLRGSSENPSQQAQMILQATGVKGGLIVHLGCGEGRLTAALHANDRYLVHGLDSEATNILKARTYLRRLGLYGQVSVEQWSGRRLPYIDNLVNLLVAEDLGEVPMEEVLRVLVPKGVAYLKRGDRWEKIVKPWPKEIDEWTHYLHDASNNAVAHDSVVGPPRGLQWVGSPRWSRHHDRMASMSALVSANGRLFYIIDEGSRASIMLPPKWSLIARDAFNGTLLWKRRIPSWWTHIWPFKSGPAQLPRRLVAVGDKVYVTLGLEAPLTVLDAATGETLRTYEGTQATEEVIASAGVLFLQVNKSPRRIDYKPVHRSIGEAKARVAREWPWDEKPRWIMAIQADTGKVLWQKEYRVVPLTLAADGQHVYFHEGERIVCLNRKTGEEVWRSEPLTRRSPIPTNFGPTLVVYQDLVLFAGGDRSMTALSAQTGKTLWKAKHHRGGHNSPEDLLVVGGLAWSGAIAGGRDSGVFTGLDLRTGEVKKEFAPDVQTYWFHHRCYRAKATERYILSSRTGIEFVDFRKQHWITHHWVRGGCIYGIMPCNGLIYAPPHDCACYIIAKLYGLNALAPKPAVGREELRGVSDEERLERGPAYGEVVEEASPAGQDEWPTYRHDAARSGFTRAAVPADLKRLWRTELGGKLSSLVIAGNKVFVASVDTHTVYALDAGSGKVLWHYTAGGRVDSPPTIYQGRVLFGSADGWVYCLRAADGKMIWRFRAAPVDRRLTAFEQLESVWPVHGSVLVQNDVVYCIAGRSMFLDGGLRLLRLDPRTGRKLSETILDERDPETGENLQVKVKGLNMPTALPDILSSDGQYIYLRAQRFNLQGQRQRVFTPSDPAWEEGEKAHLFSSIGFLDDTWFHRGYWVYGRSVLSGAAGWPRAGRVVPAGRILVLDHSSVYGYGRQPEYYKWSTPLEYHLFATSREIPSPEKPARRVQGSEIGVAKSPSLNPAHSPLTVEAWIKAKGGDGVILARGGSSHGYALLLRGGKPRFVIRVNKEISSVGARENVVGPWVHLAGVLTADRKLLLYVNGQPSGSAKALGLIAADPHEEMQIGADDGSTVGDYGSPFGFKGLIDEVRVYHRALSAEEIRQHYLNPGRTAQERALVLYYSFDQGDATDESGNKNDGTVGEVKPVEGRVGKAMRFKGKRTSGVPFRIEYRWSQEVPLHVRAMVLANQMLFIAGPPDVVDEEEAFTRFGEPEIRAQLREQSGAFEGQKGALLWAVSAADGRKLAEYTLDSPPVFDGMVAAHKRLYLATLDGRVVCYGQT
ncbi:MAG TPA: methyltransferase domain-containing protein [Armatimonadetes bacterium]|nr:methyltransferase domain-containing protein [Armatimonadota bacterium]